MFIDILGILLTIIIVSPRYWFIVLLICFSELIFTFLISVTLELSILEVIAGGIFTSINYYSNKNLFQILGPLFFLTLGFAIHTNKKKLSWFDLINPFAVYNSSLSILLVKTSVLRIIFLILVQMNK